MTKNIRRFEAKDASAVSGLISSTLWRCNSKDYPPAVLRNLEVELGAKNLLRLCEAREIFVCPGNSKIVGTASLSECRVFAVFVPADMQGRGTGSHLIAHLEERARLSGRVRLHLDATLTAVPFYLSLSYVPDGLFETPAHGRLQRMWKYLPDM